MAATNDTIDGLLAEFRGYAAGMPASYHVTMSWADFRKMLDRFDAAHRHEHGDVAKLREALFASRDFIDRVLMFLHGMETTFPGEDEIIDTIRSALGEAPKIAPDPRSHIYKI